MLSRRVVSAILLVAGTFITFLIFLSSTPSDAQTGSGNTGAATQNSNCPGAKRVNTTTGNGNKQSPVFNITSTSFRLKVDSTATSQDPQFASVNIFVYPEGETLGYVGTFDVEQGMDDSSIINAGPGSFYLNILAANVDYTITVEDCTGTSQDNGETSTQADADPVSTEDRNQGRKNKVVPGTFPKKRLAPTGGPPVFAAVTGSILVGVSIFGLGLIFRRRL